MNGADLLTLAEAAEWMASESTAADRGGRCAAYLYDVANRARAEVRALDGVDEFDVFGRDCDGQPR